MAIEFASDHQFASDPSHRISTIVDPVVDDPSAPKTSPLVSRTPPPNYLVLRGGSTQPERFQAADDGEALNRLQKEVRAGQSPVIFCYKLWVSEEYVASSKTTQF